MSENENWMGKNAPLTKEEMDAFLQKPVVARLATVASDGWPSVIPLWQEWDGEHLWLVPRNRSAFVSHIRHEPRVAVSIALETNPYTRVTIKGVAEITEGPVDWQNGEAKWLPIAQRMARRYLGEHGPDYLAPTHDRPRYLVKITPTKISTWEGVEWHPKYK